MIEHNHNKIRSAVFITFAGNCQKALSFYQDCFGGQLRLDTLKNEVAGFPGTPVVSGSLVSDTITIHGSDLVHNEGRKPGNHMAIFLHCKTAHERKKLIRKLADETNLPGNNDDDQVLIELTDAFDVRWVLSI